MNKLSDKMKENILNYSKEFKIFEEFVDGVRQVPGMYIGPIGTKGVLNMAREIIQNSFDELVKSDSPCDHVDVTYDMMEGSFTVVDNGRGIPFNIMVDNFTKPHSSTNFKKRDFQYSSGLHGIGSKVVNALSDYFIVESYILGEARRLTLKDGFPDGEPKKIKCDKNAQGTMVKFKPALSVLKDIDLDYKILQDLISSIISFLPKGSLCNFTVILKNGKIYNEKIQNIDGILAPLINITGHPLIEPIYINNDTGKMRIEAIFTYDTKAMNDYEQIKAFSNYCPTLSGTHIDGFISGVTDFFKNYMNNIYLVGQKNKLTIVNSDIRTGLKTIINAAHLYPNFTGQAKENLSNEDMKLYVKTVVADSLNNWIKTNPNDIQKLCKYFKEIALIRIKSEGGKIKLSNNYKKTAIGSYPEKFIPALGKNNLELIIIEGDSAKGTAKGARDPQTQALLPIKGKIINPMTNTKKKVLANAEASAIIDLVGNGKYGKEFNVEDSMFEKTIIMGDADADGGHIRTLVLMLFLVFLPQYVEAGRLYKAVPPLYGLTVGKDKKYFTTKKDYIAYIQKLFSKNNIIKNQNKKQLSSAAVFELLYNNADYVYELELIANKYALDPSLLELVLINRNLNQSKLEKIIKSNYRFMELNKSNGKLVATGLINSKYQTMFITNNLMSDCVNILKYIEVINENNMHYFMNDEFVSLYQIMKQFENTSPSNLSRYKGLGEMNEDQLEKTTVHPNYDRTLIRYTTKDIKKEIESIRYLQDNKYSIIENLEISRQDIL